MREEIKCTELLDILDDHGNPTGQTIDRKLAHKKGILHGASHMYIYKLEAGKIYVLLQRRSYNKDSFPGKLDISSAGHMESGMNFIETAKKELNEELGIIIKDDELREAFRKKTSMIDEFNGEIFNDQEINTIYIIKKDIDISKLKLQEEEVAEVVWMDCDEIIDRLDVNDSEICLDKVEFLDVINLIKEREKMEKDDIMKELYEEVILTGRFTNSEIIGKLASKANEYGENRQIEAMLKSSAAASLARAAGSNNDQIARGITLGVELGTPTFGEIGEEFLQEKISNYSKSSLGVALTKIMLSGLKGDKIESIINGVKNVLDGKQLTTCEEQAAQVAIDIYNTANKFAKLADSTRANSDFLQNALAETEEKGIISIYENESWINAKSMSPQKKKIIRSEKIFHKLNILYKYYCQNIGKIPNSFLKTLEGYDEKEIVAYYIMSLGEADVERILENTKDEIQH